MPARPPCAAVLRSESAHPKSRILACAAPWFARPGTAASLMRVIPPDSPKCARGRVAQNPHTLQGTGRSAAPAEACARRRARLRAGAAACGRVPHTPKGALETAPCSRAAPAGCPRSVSPPHSSQALQLGARSLSRRWSRWAWPCLGRCQGLILHGRLPSSARVHVHMCTCVHVYMCAVTVGWKLSLCLHRDSKKRPTARYTSKKIR
jgi:hypothetical protein